MTIAEVLLQDFDHEMKGVRTTLERVPEKNSEFKCHAKSMPMGHLAVHVATLPGFGYEVLTTDGMNLAGHKWPDMSFVSRQKLLADFDAASAQARAALARSSDADMQKVWTLAFGEKVIASGPRSAMYRGMFFNHLIHHRAQLGVYLQLNGQPVPALYGPSADETMGF